MRHSTRARAFAVMLVVVPTGSACGVAEGAFERVRAWWDEDEAAEAQPAEAEAQPADGPAPDLGAAAGSGGGTGGGVAAGDDQGTGGRGAPEPGGTTGPGASDGGPGSTSLPMSLAVPPTSGTGTGGDEGTGRGGTDAGDDEGASEGPAEASTGSPASASPSCLEGEWVIDDDTDYYRDQVRRQAYGRAVRRVSRGGTVSIRFDRGELNVVATHRRLVFGATLADNEIRYTVDVDGELEAPTHGEGSDVLVVETPRIDTLKAREVARFPGGKTKHRRLDPPAAEGRYEYRCGPSTLELARIVDGKPGPAIRLERPAE